MDRKNKIWIALLAILLVLAIVAVIVINGKLNASKVAFSTVSSSLADEQQKNADLTANLDEVSAQLQQSQENGAALELQVKEAEEAKTALKGELESVKTEAEANAVLLQQAQESQAALQAQVKEAEESQAVLQAQVKEAEEAKAVLEGELKSSKASTDAKDKLVEARNKLAAAQAQKRTAESELGRLKGEMKAIERQRDKALANSEQLTADYAVAKKSIAELETAAEGYQSRIAELESDVEEASAKIAELNQSLNAAQGQLTDLGEGQTDNGENPVLAGEPTVTLPPVENADLPENPDDRDVEAADADPQTEGGEGTVDTGDANGTAADTDASETAVDTGNTNGTPVDTDANATAAEYIENLETLNAQYADSLAQIETLNADLAAKEAELAEAQAYVDELSAIILENEAAIYELEVLYDEIFAELDIYKYTRDPSEGEAHSASSFENCINVDADGVTAHYDFTNEAISGNNVVLAICIGDAAVYTSEPMAPGSSINGFTFKEPLPAGEHEAFAITKVFDENGEYLSSTSVPVIIRVAQ